MQSLSEELKTQKVPGRSEVQIEGPRSELFSVPALQTQSSAESKTSPDQEQNKRKGRPNGIQETKNQGQA